jgi:hypothetical protein
MTADTMTKKKTRMPAHDTLGIATEGRDRVVMEKISPEIDAGRFAIKRVVGDTVAVEIDVFADVGLQSGRSAQPPCRRLCATSRSH